MGPADKEILNFIRTIGQTSFYFVFILKSIQIGGGSVFLFYFKVRLDEVIFDTAGLGHPARFRHIRKKYFLPLIFNLFENKGKGDKGDSVDNLKESTVLIEYFTNDLLLKNVYIVFNVFSIFQFIVYRLPGI